MLINNYIKSNNLRQTKTDIIDAKQITDFTAINFNKLKKAKNEKIDEVKLLSRRRER